MFERLCHMFSARHSLMTPHSQLPLFPKEATRTPKAYQKAAVLDGHLVLRLSVRHHPAPAISGLYIGSQACGEDRGSSLQEVLRGASLPACRLTLVLQLPDSRPHVCILAVSPWSSFDGPRRRNSYCVLLPTNKRARSSLTMILCQSLLPRIPRGPEPKSAQSLPHASAIAFSWATFGSSASPLPQDRPLMLPTSSSDRFHPAACEDRCRFSRQTHFVVIPASFGS